MDNIKITIEGIDRDPLVAVVKDSDPIGRVTLGKRFGERRLLILALEYLDPQDRIFIELKNRYETSSGLDQPARETRIREPLDPLAVRALNFILQEFSSRREPSMVDVAKNLDISARELGTVLRPIGIDAQSTSRNWKPVRLYPIKLKTKVQALLDDLR